jgi:hypothetical protein
LFQRARDATLHEIILDLLYFRRDVHFDFLFLRSRPKIAFDIGIAAHSALLICRASSSNYILSTTAIAYNGYDFGFHPEK